MQTRKHFAQTAALIAALPVDAREQAIEQWSAVFAAENPRFDSGKFRAACRPADQIISHRGVSPNARRRRKAA